MKNEHNKVNVITKIVLLFGATMALMSGAALTTATTAMMAEFEGMPNIRLWISMVLTLPALFVVIGGPVSGFLTDRFGRKKILVSALFLCGLSGSAGVFLHSIWAILGTRALLGLGIAGVSTATNALISDLFGGESRSRFLGFQSAVTGLNGIAFFILGGILVNANWRFSFLAYSPLLILFLLAWIFVREPEVVRHHGDEMIESKLRLDGKKAFIFSATFISQFIYVTLPVFIAYYLADLLGANGTMIGIAGAISNAVSFLIGLFYGRIKQRMTFPGLFLIASIASGIGFLVLGLAQSWFLIVLAEVILGFFVGLNLSNLPAWLASEVGPNVRGRANGIYVMMMYFGQFASSIVFTPIVQVTGYETVYFIVSGLSVLTGFGVFFLPQESRQLEKTDSEA
jgi:MFS family permease